MTTAAHISLRDVSVTFPVLSFRDRSLRSRFVSAVTLRRNAAVPHIVSALSGVNLDIRAGDRLAIVGANGAGKTTLLRVLAGIYHPTAGSVDVNGRCLSLFDLSAGFDEEATGYENIMPGRSTASPIRTISPRSAPMRKPRLPIIRASTVRCAMRSANSGDS